MKKCSGFKKGICITLAMVALISTVATKELIKSKANESIDKVFYKESR